MANAVEESRGVLPEWFPSDLPTDKAELSELASKLGQVTPRVFGSGKFNLAVNRYLNHSKLEQKALTELHRVHRYMQGHRGPAVVKSQKARGMRALARKFYDRMSEQALRTHCQMAGLDYDSFETVDERLDALVEKAATLV